MSCVCMRYVWIYIFNNLKDFYFYRIIFHLIGIIFFSSYSYKFIIIILPLKKKKRTHLWFFLLSKQVATWFSGVPALSIYFPDTPFFFFSFLLFSYCKTLRTSNYQWRQFLYQMVWKLCSLFSVLSCLLSFFTHSLPTVSPSAKNFSLRNYSLSFSLSLATLLCFLSSCLFLFW